MFNGALRNPQFMQARGKSKSLEMLFDSIGEVVGKLFLVIVVGIGIEYPNGELGIPLRLASSHIADDRWQNCRNSLAMNNIKLTTQLMFDPVSGLVILRTCSQKAMIEHGC